MKAISFILKELYNLGDALDLDMLENDFNWKFHIIESENVAKNQRPFLRTMYFIKEDLGLLNTDYSIKEDILNSNKDEDILYAIYTGASTTLQPFQKMQTIFHTLKKRLYDWEEFKNFLSHELIISAKNEYPKSFENKDEHTKGGIYFWKMDDPSIHRLVELGRELGICSFVVLKHIRYVSDFEYGKSIKTRDLQDILEILMKKIPNIDESVIFSVDEIMAILDEIGVPLEVLEDAIATDKKYVVLYSGRKKEKKSVSYKGDTYYRLSFTKESFEGDI